MEMSAVAGAAPRPSLARRALWKIVGPTTRAALRPIGARMRALERELYLQRVELERQALAHEALKRELIAVTHRVEWREQQADRRASV